MEPRPTIIKLEEQYQDRWSFYGDEAGILELSQRLSPAELKQYDLFKNYPDKFLEELSPEDNKPCRSRRPARFTMIVPNL